MEAGLTRWLVAVLVLAASGLVACGGGDGAAQPDPQPTETVASPAPTRAGASTTPPPKLRPVEGSGSNWSTNRDEFTDDLRTYLFRWDGDTFFSITCYEGRIVTSVQGLAVPISDIRDEFSVRWRVDSNPVVAETWEGVDNLQDGHMALTRDVGLYFEARYGSSLIIELTGYLDIAERFRFDLSGMFDTPVQWNIDNCGEY